MEDSIQDKILKRNGVTQEQLDKTKEKCPKIINFKNNDLICLFEDNYGGFSFGMKKAKAIVENIDAIRNFVESGGKSI